MAEYYVRSTSSVPRANSTAYSSGQRLHIARGDSQTNNGIMRRYVYEVTTAGTTGASPPVYPTTAGSTVSDGTAVLTCRECTNWTDASPYLDYISSRTAAGDTVYVSQNHAEVPASDATCSFAGTIAAPNLIVCVDDTSGTPPTVQAVNQTAIATANNTSYFMNGCYTLEGVGISLGSSGAGLVLWQQGLNTSAAVRQMYKNVELKALSTSGSNQWIIGSASAGNQWHDEFVFRNCMFKALNGSATPTLNNITRFEGGGMYSGTYHVQGVFSTGRPITVTFDAFDFSALSSSQVLFRPSTGKYIARNCKLPASWTGTPLYTAGLSGPGCRAELYNCDSDLGNGTVVYRTYIQDYLGSLQSWPAVQRTSGSNLPGTTWRITPTANTVFPHLAFESCQTAVWNDTVGSAITLKMFVAQDGGSTLTNADIWMDVQYLSASGIPLTSFLSTQRSSVGTLANYSSSSQTFSGLTSPNVQEMSLTFTPNVAGYISIRVFTAKPSITVYVCPKPEIS